MKGKIRFDRESFRDCMKLIRTGGSNATDLTKEMKEGNKISTGCGIGIPNNENADYWNENIEDAKQMQQNEKIDRPNGNGAIQNWY